MTKLKNTKKGMAKKALSISLVAAMLATSNVPVWAAEDLFSDGSAAVEAPAVVEEPAAEVQAFSAEPVEETADAVQTQATAKDDSYTITLSEDFKTAVKDGVFWNEVDNENKSLNVTIDTAEGVPAYAQYVWKDKSGNAITDETWQNVNDGVTLNLGEEATKYAGQDIYLYIYIKGGSNGQIIWDYTSDPIRIKAVDITAEGVLTFSGTEYPYTGEDIKPKITGIGSNAAGYGLKTSDFTLNYSGKNGDTVNVGDVTVTATVNKAGYTGTLTGTYKIVPRVLDSVETLNKYVNISLKNTSMPYTGDADYNIYASDVTVTDKKTGADVSYLLSKDNTQNNRVGKLAGAKEVDTTGNPEIDIYSNDNNKNFVTGANIHVYPKTQNKMTIVARDLSTVTATINDGAGIKYDGDVVTADEVARLITYKDVNGNILDLADVVKITVPSNAKDVGTYTATIEPKDNNKNVTKSATVKFTIFKESIAGARFEKVAGTTLKSETYTGKQITKDVSSFGKVYIDTDNTGTYTDGDTVLTSSDYEIKYGTNIDAGTGAGKLYIVGKGNYEGTQVEYTFNIDKADVDELSASETVEYIPGAEVADYKEAFALKVTASDGKITLVEGDDYTVEYKFVAENKVDNQIEAKVKLKDTKNFNTLTEDTITAKITYTQLKDSDIVMNQSSYEYTGEIIEPDFDLVVNGRTISPDNYTVSISNGTEAGTASFTVTAKADSQAIAGSAKGTFTITPADVSKVDVVIPSQPYTGYSIIPTADKFEVTFNGKEYTGTAAKTFIESNFKLSYGENIDMGEEAGTVTLTPKTTNKNFTGTKAVKFTISGKFIKADGSQLNFYDENGLRINGFVVENSFNPYTDGIFDYNGKALTASKTVYTNDSMELTEGTDYEILYVDNISGKKVYEGTIDDMYSYGQYGAVLVVAKGQYAGDYDSTGFVIDTKGTLAVKDGIYTCADGTKISNVAYAGFFKINQLWINADKNISVSNGTYAAGFQVKPEVTVSVDGVVLTEGKDYKLNYDESQDRVNVTSSKSLWVEIEGINGYTGGGVFYWGIDKFDLANATVSYNGTSVSLKCGKVDIDPSEFTVSVDGSKVTVTAAKDSKNYTGSKTVDIELEDEKPAAPVIQAVKVSGNNATVVLAGESDGATGYDYVISTDRDCINTKDYDGVNKNKLTTETTFTYVEQGTYYAYCHAWKRVDGEKVFSDWSAAYPFSVSSITPDQPVITKLEKSTNGKHLRVTWTKCANATGYDIVMGTKVQKVNDELRPVEYGKAVKKVTNGNTVSVIFYNIPKGTYYVGLHAYNRTSETGVKVFSPWSNSKEVKF